MRSIINLLLYLFSNKKTLVYTTHEKEEYSEVIEKLETAGVNYRVATRTQTSQGKHAMLYKIYVKKTGEHKALQAMYHG